MTQRILKWIVSIGLILISTSVFAKGNPERIVITGPTLGEAVIVDDDETVRLLSIGQFEALGEGELPEPENLGDEWYELQRQYETTPGQFQSFDSVRYYPNPDGGRGYVFYVGITGGWSEYDGNWYYVTSEGEVAIQRALVGRGAAHAVTLINDAGMLYRIDPLTLTEISSVQIGTEGYAINGFRTTYDGQQAFYTSASISADVRPEQRVFNPEAGVNCRVSDRHLFVMELPTSNNLLFGSDFGTLQIRNRDTLTVESTFYAPRNYDHAQYFPSPDGMMMYVLSTDEYGLLLTLYDAANERYVIATNLGDQLTGGNYAGMWMTDYPSFYLSDGHTLAMVNYNIWERIPRLNFILTPLDFSAVESGVELIPAFAYRGWSYLHHALGRNWQGDEADITAVPGGIYKANGWGSTDVFHWHPDIPFSQVIIGGDYIYALSMPLDSDTTTLYRLDPEEGEILATRELSGDDWSLAYTRLADDFGQGDGLVADGCDGLNVAGNN